MLNAKIVFTALPCLRAISIIDSTLAMKVDVLNKAFKIVTRYISYKDPKHTEDGRSMTTFYYTIV